MTLTVGAFGLVGRWEVLLRVHSIPTLDDAWNRAITIEGYSGMHFNIQFWILTSCRNAVNMYLSRSRLNGMSKWAIHNYKSTYLLHPINYSNNSNTYSFYFNLNLYWIFFYISNKANCFWQRCTKIQKWR